MIILIIETIVSLIGITLLMISVVEKLTDGSGFESLVTGMLLIILAYVSGIGREIKNDKR